MSECFAKVLHVHQMPAVSKEDQLRVFCGASPNELETFGFHRAVRLKLFLCALVNIDRYFEVSFDVAELCFRHPWVSKFTVAVSLVFATIILQEKALGSCLGACCPRFLPVLYHKMGSKRPPETKIIRVVIKREDALAVHENIGQFYLRTPRNEPVMIKDLHAHRRKPHHKFVAGFQLRVELFRQPVGF